MEGGIQTQEKPCKQWEEMEKKIQNNMDGFLLVSEGKSLNFRRRVSD